MTKITLAAKYYTVNPLGICKMDAQASKGASAKSCRKESEVKVAAHVLHWIILS